MSNVSGKKDNPSSIKKILILGHDGFIGRYLFPYFVTKEPGKEIIGKSFPEIDLTCFKGTRKISNLFDKRTAVIMCSFIKKQYGDNIDIFKKNIAMITNLCRVIEERPVRRFIYFSSAEVYGDDIENTDITELTPVNPSTYYGIAKYAGEKLFSKVVHRNHGLSFIALRLPLVYGPLDPSHGYGPSGFIYSTIIGEEIKIWGKGEELREFVFIDDVIKLVHELAFSDYNGEVNIASGNSNSFTDILDMVRKISTSKIEVSFQSRTKPKVDIKFRKLRLLELLPKYKFTSLASGVRKTFDVELNILQSGKAIR
jgi:UDP-glucose 4-epimerase